MQLSTWLAEIRDQGYNLQLVPDTPPVLPEERFLQGYRDGGGSPYPEEQILRVVDCELRGWRDGRLNPNPDYRGAPQFHPDTWARARRSVDADPDDLYEAGWAMAHWIDMLLASGSNPAGTGGWPGCARGLLE